MIWIKCGHTWSLEMQSKKHLPTGTICLVRFHPSIGSELKKFRPAVVISDKINQTDSRFVLIAPFTTSIKSLDPHSELLIKKGTALEKDSALLCWYLRTIDVNRVQATLGRLTPEEIAKMKQLTQGFFK